MMTLVVTKATKVFLTNNMEITSEKEEEIKHNTQQK